ncbi:MAG TPA: BatA domain-containing protein [Gemmatimonadaceae bacterium]|nr:BatA domain-containing protein [Gemmatimonadaceae bacterium]
MSFLAPLFLAGLAALSVPVIIHMINRERREVVQFPSLMFLQRIPYRSVRRQKLRHILLLTLRCLALAIVVMAFARPFVRRQGAPQAARSGARELVVLIDRSYSMGAGDHWTRAQSAARRAVAPLGPADRATIVAFDDDAAAVTPPTHEIATLNAAIGNLRPTSEATRYAPALKLASQILAGTNLPRREVVLISDFQRLGWSVRDEISFPTGTTITNVDIAAGDTITANAAVADVNIQRSEGERDRATIAARLTNTGAAPLDAVDVTLELNGRVADTRRVVIPAHGATQVRFASMAIPSGTSAGIVHFAVPAAAARGDQLATDDRYYFTIAPDAGVSVLVVEPSAARTNQSLFLTRALAIGDRPSFRIDVRKTGGLAPADLDNRSLIIFDEVAPPVADGGARLRDFIANGGGVLIVAGDQLPANAWQGEWSSALPGPIGSVVDRAGDAGGTLAWIDYDHPVFDVFNAPRSGDFATARFLRYRRLTVRPDSGVQRAAGVADTASGSHVLARFDDGAPALVEHRVGRGKVLVWASTLDSYWNDLALQPVYLPFVHQVAKYAGRYSGARPWFTAGEVLDLSRHGELTNGAILSRKSGAGALVVEAPSGAKMRVPSSNEALIPLHEQGLYEIRPEGAARGMGQRVAVNLDPAEANLARIDPEELKASVLASAGGTAATGAVSADSPTREDTERRQTIWWYLLALAGVLLATETLMSNRLSRRNA